MINNYSYVAVNNTKEPSVYTETEGEDSKLTVCINSPQKKLVVFLTGIQITIKAKTRDVTI